MADDTVLRYSTEHGDPPDEKCLITKSLTDQIPAGVPLVVAGPDGREDVVVTTPMSLAHLEAAVARIIDPGWRLRTRRERPWAPAPW